MEKKLGLYVSSNDDGTLNRTLVSVFGEVQLEPATVKDEVILFSELNFYFYAFVMDRIKIASRFLLTHDTDDTHAADMKAFEFIQDTVQDLIEEFEDDNLFYGTLTRTVIEDFVPKDDGSGLYPFEATRKIISCLSEVMDFQFVVNDILRDMRFKVPIDFDEKYHFLQEAEFVQISKFQNLHAPEYAFRSLVEYYKFLLIHFISLHDSLTLLSCIYENEQRLQSFIYTQNNIADSINIFQCQIRIQRQSQNSISYVVRRRGFLCTCSQQIIIALNCIC